MHEISKDIRADNCKKLRLNFHRIIATMSHMICCREKMISFLGFHSYSALTADMLNQTKQLSRKRTQKTFLLRL